jgi:hypothetical protein
MSNLIGTTITQASTSSATAVDFYEDTDNGTNKVTLIAPASIASDKTQTMQDLTGTIALQGTDIVDTNSNEILKIGTTASAVNEFTVTNAATGGVPTISATGDDTNIGLKISGKGTGKVYPALAAGLVSCTGATNTTGTADITGATVTFTPNVACYAIVNMTADLSSSVAGDIIIANLVVDGAAQSQTCLFTAPIAGYRATVSQVFLVTLTAASHTIKMQVGRASGTGTVTAQITHTNFTYVLISQ